MLKKILLICVCVLAMTSAVYAGSEELWVGGVMVTGSGQVTGEGITGSVTYDASTKTLTLSNATIEGSISTEGLKTLTIVGDGTISGENGIQVESCDLTVEGTGSGITVNAEEYGIHNYDGTILLKGTVNATAENNSAIMADNDIVIADGAKVNATSNLKKEDDDYFVDGIYSEHGPITINGGEVTAKGYNAGIGTRAYVEDLGDEYKPITIKGGTVTATGVDNGIYSHKALTIKDCTVVATSTNIYEYPGCDEYSGWSYAGAIYNEFGELHIENSHVTANSYSNAILACNGTLTLGSTMKITKPVGGSIYDNRAICNSEGNCVENAELAVFDTNVVPVPDALVTDEFSYTGKEQKAVSGVYDGFTWSGTTSATNAGEFSCKAVLTDKANSKWSDGTTADRTYNWKITPYKVKYVYATINPEVYTGSPITPTPTVSILKGDDDELVLTKGTDYDLSYKDNVNVGTATMTVTLKGNYAGSVDKQFEIAKAENTLSVKGKKVNIKYSKLKKKNQTSTKGFSFSNKGVGKPTYTKSKGNKKITINKTTGKITVKKGLKKGKYPVKVKVKVPGDANYKAKTKTVTVTVVVK